MQIRKTLLSKFKFPSLNSEKDAPLFKSPRCVKDTDTPADHGTDLFVHTAPDGSMYYYLYHWSVYPNETNVCQIMSKDSARDFILEHVRRGDRLNIVYP